MLNSNKYAKICPNIPIRSHESSILRMKLLEIFISLFSIYRFLLAFVGVEPPTYGYLKKGEKGIFQRRYFEHTIIDEKDLNNQINYIHYNPVKHGYAKSVKDWEYSSFHKFVKKGLYDINWGSNTDIKEIIDLNFE